MAIFSLGKTGRYSVIFFLILSSLISYFIDSYGVIISHSMIQNILETDTHEAFDLLSSSFFSHIFIYGIIPSIIVWFIPLKQQKISAELKTRAIFVLVLLSITASFAYTSLKDIAFISRENRELRFYINPVYPVISAYKYLKSSFKDTSQAIEVVYSDSAHELTNTSDRHTLLVVVVGETARADSFKLNGYARNTTPSLNNLNILNFSNTVSCGTATAESIPCMFSDITHDDFNLNKIRHRENLLDALQYAGIDVLWKENDSGCKGVCSRSKTQVMPIVENDSLCKGSECYDEILLNNLNEYIKNVKTDTVLFLHQQGSHGPAYYKRVPEEYVKFKPVCATKALQNCTNTEIINSYDNTIVYTDHVLAEVIKTLKSNEGLDTAMIYMSDHGESLGEAGVYLHGLPYFMAPKEQTHIPFIVWLSTGMIQDDHINYSCLVDSTSKQYSHDNFIHSVLGIMNVSTKAYNNELDIFSPCRNNETHIVGTKATINSGNI